MFNLGVFVVHLTLSLASSWFLYQSELWPCMVAPMLFTRLSAWAESREAKDLGRCQFGELFLHAYVGSPPWFCALMILQFACFPLLGLGYINALLYLCDLVLAVTTITQLEMFLVMPFLLVPSTRWAPAFAAFSAFHLQGLEPNRNFNPPLSLLVRKLFSEPSRVAPLVLVLGKLFGYFYINVWMTKQTLWPVSLAFAAGLGTVAAEWRSIAVHVTGWHSCDDQK